MDTKTTSWVSYLTFIGWLIAYLTGDKEGAKFHLNQSLIINIGFFALALLNKVLILIPIIGWLAYIVADIFLIVVWVMGLIYAINQEEKEVPLIGQIKILK